MFLTFGFSFFSEKNRYNAQQAKWNQTKAIDAPYGEKSAMAIQTEWFKHIEKKSFVTFPFPF